MDRSDDDSDPDADGQREALAFIARRAAIWAVPLVLVGVLLVALGIPFWVTAIGLVILMVILVFEIDI